MKLTEKFMVPLSLIPHIQVRQNAHYLMEGVPLEDLEPTITVTTDACNTGWGGYVREFRTSISIVRRC